MTSSDTPPPKKKELPLSYVVLDPPSLNEIQIDPLMAVNDSSQFLALQHCAYELRIAISADITRVAEKLFAKKVISQLSSVRKGKIIVVSVRASEPWPVTQDVASSEIIDQWKFNLMLS